MLKFELNKTRLLFGNTVLFLGRNGDTRHAWQIRLNNDGSLYTQHNRFNDNEFEATPKTLIGPNSVGRMISRVLGLT